MKYTKFIKETCRTFNYQNPKTDIQHCVLGMIDEVGELASAVKKKVGYGKTINITNVLEEIGDLSFFMAQLTYLLKFTDPIKTAMYKDLDIAASSRKETKKVDMFGDVVLLNKYVTSLVDCLEENSETFINQYMGIKLLMIDIMSSIAARCDTTYEKVLDANIAKLKIRFPEKFDSDLVDEENRNRELEAKKVNENTTDEQNV